MDGENSGWVVGAIGAIGTLAGILYGLYQKLKKSKKEDERTAIGYYRGIIDRMTTQHAAELQRMREERDKDRSEYKEQIRLHNQQMTDAQKAIELLKQQISEGELDKEILWTMVDRQHEQAVDKYECCCRLQECVRKLGGDPGRVPKEPAPLPQRPQRKAGLKEATDRAVREAEQGAVLLKNSKSIKERQG